MFGLVIRPSSTGIDLKRVTDSSTADLQILGLILCDTIAPEKLVLSNLASGSNLRRLTILRTDTQRQSGETTTSVSAGHIILS